MKYTWLRGLDASALEFVCIRPSLVALPRDTVTAKDRETALRTEGFEEFLNKDGFAEISNWS